MRFRLRTLLSGLALATCAVGVGRYWYDVQVAPSRQDRAVVASEEFRGVVVRWSGERRGWAPQFGRVVHVWFDETEAFDAAATRLNELTAVESVQVLWRQLSEHAEAAERGESDEVLAAWRRRPTLRQVLVDASVRGAPLGDSVALPTRDDMELLKRALPNVEIVWMEVH